MTSGRNTATKSIIVPYPTFFYVESTGTGSGVATLQIYSEINCTATLIGGAKFYTTVDGNSGETDSKEMTANTRLIAYIKCTSGTSTLKLNTKRISKIENYISPTNAPSLNGDCSNMIKLTEILVSGKVKFNFSITKLVNLTSLFISAGYNTGTISGDITGLTKLKSLGLTESGSPISKVTTYGDLSKCVLDTWLETDSSHVAGYYGDLSNLALKIVSLNGNNTCSVTLDNITTLEYFKSTNVTVNVTRVILLTKLSYFSVLYITKDATWTNQVLADFWTNRDQPKTSNPTYRDIGINGVNIAAPTGQGLIDKAALQNYRSPNNDAGVDLWRVYTN